LFALAVLAACREAEPRRDVVIDYSDRLVGELLAGTTVEQSFVPDHDGLCAVAVVVATYGGTPRCKVRFRLRAEGSAAIISEQVRGCSKIADNSAVRFDFPPLVATRGRRLVFSIDSPNGRPGNRVSLWMASIPGIYPDGALSVNGQPVPGALRFTTFHR